MTITKRKYLSPSAVSLWFTNRAEFVTKYLVADRPPRIPQTLAMSVGSAFDACVKADIALQFGLSGFEFDALFEKQVEVQNRDFAQAAGKDCFDQYVSCGAHKSLINRLKDSCGVRMEFSSMGTVDASSGGVYAPVGSGASDPVVVLGIPDLAFVTNGGVAVVHDFKVNGYCSASRTSPFAGYCYTLPNGKTHRDALLFHYKDMEINASHNLERSPWADQLCCYSWLTGIPVGGEMIVSVDQLCFTGGVLTVAQHRSKISVDYQLSVLTRFQAVWDAIASGHIFEELPREENDTLLMKLARQGAAYSDDDKGAWLASITRKHAW